MSRVQTSSIIGLRYGLTRNAAAGAGADVDAGRVWPGWSMRLSATL